MLCVIVKGIGLIYKGWIQCFKMFVICFIQNVYIGICWMEVFGFYVIGKDDFMMFEYQVYIGDFVYCEICCNVGVVY